MQAVYYRDPSGIEPVRDFLEDLAPRLRETLLLQIDRLNMLEASDPPLAFPHSSQVEGGCGSFAATTERPHATTE